MKKPFLSVFLIFVLCGLLAGCQCEHEWNPATCTTPKTCSKCGETEGDPIAHTWIDATCTTVRTCSVCNATEGDLAPHIWIDATCTTPKTCAVCTTTEGDPLGHVDGEWVIDEESSSTVSGTVWRRLHCALCDSILETELTSFPLYENGKFLFSPTDFSNRLEIVFSTIKGCNFTTELTPYSDLLGCFIKDTTYFAVVTFLGDNHAIASSDLDSKEVDALLVFFNTDESEYIGRVLVAMILACDSSLSGDEAENIAVQAISAATTNESFYHNGLCYFFFRDDNGYKFMVFISEE